MEFTYEELMNIEFKVVDSSATYKYNEKYNNHISETNIANNTNGNKVKVPTICPKCGNMIALIDNGSKVGCSKYPECRYVVIWNNNKK